MPKKKPPAKPKTKPAPTVPSDDLDGEIAREAEDRGQTAGSLNGMNREEHIAKLRQAAGIQPSQPAESFPTQTQDSETATKDEATSEDPAQPPLATENAGQIETGKIVDSAEDGKPASYDGIALPPARARDGENSSRCWERLRREARAAGMTRRGAIAYATTEVQRLFPPEPPPEPVIVEDLSVEDPPEVLPTIGTSSVAVVPAPPADDQGVSGLSTLPAHWPELPANAQLQVEIAWVTANRLRVRSGTGVDLSKALSPAPSYSALSWLETSILFPAKFADISVKATADNDSEKEFIRREKLAIEEIRSILGEMLEAGDV